VFSAIRVEGKRAYQAARKGTADELPPRPVTIHRIELVAYEPPYRLVLDVRCSKGTYIRSLAHDIGQALGCGAYLRALRRTEIGTWSITDARTITEWTEVIKSQRQRVSGTGQAATLETGAEAPGGSGI
jgi:tRNA pseudouridine55 synthase